MSSLAFQRSKRGKLTFQRDPITRDYVRDSLQVYAVLRTVAMDKGAYYFGSPADGTMLGTITSDRSATGSQITAAAQDGLTQVQAMGLIVAKTPTAQRIRAGAWSLTLPYVAAGQERAEKLEIR